MRPQYGKLYHKELSCVYAILNLKNGNYYIGRSLDAWKRWEQHYAALKFKKYVDEKPLMQEDYNQYGKQSFAFIVLCEKVSIEFIEGLEAFLIKSLNPVYNKMLASKDKDQQDFFLNEWLISEFKAKFLPSMVFKLEKGKKYKLKDLWRAVNSTPATGISSKNMDEFVEIIKKNNDTFDLTDDGGIIKTK